MMPAAVARRHRLRVLSYSYRRFRLWDDGVCTYCGNSAETTDHVPALLVAYEASAGKLEESGIPLLLVPACRECNSWLGAKKLLTVHHRAEYIFRKLNVLLDNIPSAQWSADELDELGPNLRIACEAGSILILGVMRRIRHAEATASMTAPARDEKRGKRS